MSKEYGPYHRTGQPGGPGCPVGILPISAKGPDDTTFKAELLDAGKESTELELLRTIASRLGVRWGHDEGGWWAVVRDCNFPSWAVWRQDDSGNRFLVEANLTEEQGRLLVADFESKGHKQAYWCSNERITC
jgi:hypothetical protein